MRMHAPDRLHRPAKPAALTGGARPEPIRTIIADDEEFSRAAVRVLFRGRPEFKIVAMAADGSGALDAIHWHEPDLVLLDVEMPGLQGFEVVDLIRLPRKPAVIFTTANHSFACRAFDVGALDYLVKPYTRSRFDLALRRVLAHFDCTAEAGTALA